MSPTVTITATEGQAGEQSTGHRLGSADDAATPINASTHSPVMKDAATMSRSSSTASKTQHPLAASTHSLPLGSTSASQGISTASDYQNHIDASTNTTIHRNTALRLASFATYPAPTYKNNVFHPSEQSVGITDPLMLETRRMPEEKMQEIRRTHGRITGGKLQNFYREQNNLITSLLTNGTGTEEVEEREREEREAKGKVKIAVYGSLFANVLLFILQLYAAISSGSLSIFATMADSFMDLLSSAILALTNRAISRNNIFKYPVGKTRLETAGIIVFSSLMATVSVQLIIEAARRFAEGAPTDAQLHVLSIVFVGVALATKFALYLYCTALSAYPSPRILALDHRNDLIVNGFGLTTSILGTKVTWLLDPIGATVIAIIILTSWAKTAWEQIQLIIGKSAPPAFLQRITYLTLTHDPKILGIDTCQAYHAGNNLFVEVDIVMDANTPLWESHDVGEGLQKKLELLEGVERAFVHVDYETNHVQEHRKHS